MDMPQQHLSFPTLRFLLVDRDAAALQATERYLRMAGALHVHTAHSVEAAVELLSVFEPPFDCVICAEDLTPISGVEFLKNLRCGKYANSSRMRAIKFIMLTLHRELELVRATKMLDVSAYVVKPIDYVGFIHHVRGAMTHDVAIKASNEYEKVDISEAVRLPFILKR